MSADAVVATDSAGRWPRRPVRILAYGAGLALGVTALVTLLPVVSGAPWGTLAATLRAAPAEALAGLVALWAVGLLAHTLALTAALPGLTHRRALLLSLTGSAVANVLPLGGAAGVALNYRMTRRWGFSPARFASYTVVTNLWDVLVKLVLPLALLPVIVLGPPAGRTVTDLSMAAAIALPLVAATAAWLLLRPGPVAHLRGPLGGRLVKVRETTASVIESGWPRLTLGTLLYTGLLLVLLAGCLHVTNAGVPLWLVLPAFCTERLVTLAGLTPGGLGLVEVGLAAVLMMAPDASAAGIASGVLLYRGLTFGLEIPVGGLLLAGWTCWHWARPA